MKFVKILTTVIALAIITSATPVFASSNSKDVKTLISESSISSSSDNAAINSISDSSLNSIKEILKLDKKPSFKKDGFFKVYKLENPDLVKAYKNHKGFDKNISKDYNWLAPVTVDGQDTLLGKFDKDENNQWSMIGFSDSIKTDAYSFFTSKEAIAEVLAKINVKNASEIKFIAADLYKTNIIYIRKGNDEFGVPFTSKPEIVGVENGKLYPMADLVKVLEKNSPVSPSSNEKTGGGAGNTNNSQAPIPFIALAILSLGGLVFVNKDKFSFNK